MSEVLPTEPAPPRGPHFPLPVELPVVDEPSGTDVDLRQQIVRFVAVGGLSAVVDYSIYWVLSSVFGVQLSVAKSLSFICGTTTAYVINRRWTFQAEPNRRRFVAVVALYAVTFAIQVGLNAVVFHALPDSPWRKFAAFVVAQGAATLINFIAQRLIIFKLL